MNKTHTNKTHTMAIRDMPSGIGAQGDIMFIRVDDDAEVRPTSMKEVPRDHTGVIMLALWKVPVVEIDHAGPQ